MLENQSDKIELNNSLMSVLHVLIEIWLSLIGLIKDLVNRHE